MSRPVHNTGIKITDEVYSQMKKALEPSVEIDLERNMTISRPGNPRVAIDILKEFALSKGLPELLPTYNYCLSGMEIVCFKEGIKQ